MSDNGRAPIAPQGGVPANLTFTAEQWVWYSQMDLAVHMLTGQVNQLRIAKQEAPAAVLERCALKIAEQRDKFLRQAQLGIVIVGADGMPPESA